ncbi:MAG: cytochrome c3 family protein [Desulfobacter sp.]|nr:MAG: cytochrome c3 family protein [Desulfobacter sp.]
MEEKKSTRFITAIIIAALFLFAPVSGFSGQGREKINLDGGKIGTVAFNHHLHQTLVGDCMVCHKSFPQKEGALNAAKAAGELKKKQVMNKTCLKCHKAKKKAGEKHGPTSCKACHKK